MNNGKITLLLLDDQPFSMDDGIVDIKNGASSKERNVISENFNLIWLENIVEIKAYFDGLKELKNIDSKKINTLCILPEIIIFDYCLTRSQFHHKDRTQDPTNPNNILYQELIKYRPARDSLSIELQKKPGSNVSYNGKDRYGLFSGTLLCTFFYDYLTTGIPTTAHSDIANSPDEAGLMEWYHEEQMRFVDKERKKLDWGQLLFESLKGVRDRFIELVETNVIKVDVNSLIEDVIKLEECPPITYKNLLNTKIKLNHISYGKKELLLSALFYDHFFNRDGETLMKMERSKQAYTETRDPQIILDTLTQIIDLSLKDSIDKNEYTHAFSEAQRYIQAWIDDAPLTETFLTKNGYTKEQQKRRLLIGMVLLLERLEADGKIPKEINFRTTLTEVFFSEVTDDARRQSLRKAGIKLEDIFNGKINTEDETILKLLYKNINSWPRWWVI